MLDAGQHDIIGLKDLEGEFILSEFAENDSSMKELVSVVLCSIHTEMPLGEWYEEAVGLHTFVDVLRRATDKYALGNVQQRALISASTPGTRRLNYDAVLKLVLKLQDKLQYWEYNTIKK